MFAKPVSPTVSWGVSALYSMGADWLFWVRRGPNCTICVHGQNGDVFISAAVHKLVSVSVEFFPLCCWGSTNWRPGRHEEEDQSPAVVVGLVQKYADPPVAGGDDLAACPFPGSCCVRREHNAHATRAARLAPGRPRRIKVSLSRMSSEEP